jgi:hypothetical protein
MKRAETFCVARLGSPSISVRIALECPFDICKPTRLWRLMVRMIGRMRMQCSCARRREIYALPLLLALVCSLLTCSSMMQKTARGMEKEIRDAEL